ncbi:MAG TPA: hypothetical protein VHB79_37580 [Polyangiaceae bacterium]|nr:hypothetical protein [Polyangiaceae bacterium]
MKNKLIAAVVTLACLLVIALWLWRPRPAAPPTREVSNTPAATAATAPLFEIQKGEPAPEAPVATNAPIIDSIVVEKSEVCEGEENLITVKAHSPDNADGYLHVVFLGQGSGTAVPIRAMFDHHGQPLIPEIRVFGKDGSVTAAQIPPFQVKHCAPHRALSLSVQKMINTHAGYRVYGQLIELERVPGSNPTPFKALRYQWDFGDGSSLDTSEPFAEHEFNRLDPDKQFSSFVVKLRGIDEQGNEVSGRTSLEIENDAFSALKVKNVVQIFSSMEPRFAVLQGGTVRQHFRLFHHHPADVHITHLQLSWLGEDKSEIVEPEALLGGDTVLAGQPLEFELRVSLSEHPKFVGLNVSIEGFSEDGHVAGGLFSLMRPGEDPTPEHHVAVNDPDLKARILRARELLHQQFVSDEDLLNLEQQGKFDDLKPTPERVAQQEHEVVNDSKLRAERR